MRLDSGFDVVIETNGPVAHGHRLNIDFFLNNWKCMSRVGVVCDPRALLAERRATLSAQRVTKLENLILNEAERLAHSEITESLPVVGHIDPAFACNLHCPLCLSERIRRDGFNIPILKIDMLDSILETFGPTLVRVWLALWGEPILNKRLPEIVTKCKAHDIWTMISSNMSVPLSDQ
jgi:organic radical activating enzyme